MTYLTYLNYDTSRSNSDVSSVASQSLYRSEPRLNRKQQPKKVKNISEGKLKILGNKLYLVGNDKPDNLNGYPSNQFYPYIYRAGGVSHWDRCLSLFTRSLRHFFAPTSSFPSHFLTSKNNDK